MSLLHALRLTLSSRGSALLRAGALAALGALASALGQGISKARTSPVRLTNLGTGVAALVENGYSTGCAIRGDRSLWCWGSGSQLGDGTTVTRWTPGPVTALGTQVQQVGVGDYHSCARRSDGTLWCWGTGYYGTLGEGSTTATNPLPLQVTALGTTVAELAVGTFHTCCWGWNGYGQLGNGASNFMTDAGYMRATPVQVTNLGTSVVAVRLGHTHTCARRSDGSVWCWGRNDQSQLGSDATTEPVTSIPQPLAPCGDGICSMPERLSGGCAADCKATCGDCVCDGVLEDAASCPANCVAGNTCTPGVCGNGKCDATENCQLCATDCGTCYPF